MLTSLRLILSSNPLFSSVVGGCMAVGAWLLLVEQLRRDALVHELTQGHITCNLLLLVFSAMLYIGLSRGPAHGATAQADAPAAGRTEKRWQHVLESLGEALWECDVDQDRVTVSRPLHQMLGYESGQIPTAMAGVTALIHPEDADRYQFEIQRHTRGEIDICVVEHRLMKRDGDFVWVLSRVRVLDRAGDGAPLRIVGMITDIHRLKLAEEALRLASQIVLDSHDAVFITDAIPRIIHANPAFTELTGYSASEVIGKNPSLLSSGKHDKEFYLRMWRSLQETGSWQGEVCNRRKDGSLIIEWETISAVRDVNGTITHYAATFSDITQHRNADETVHRLAHFDPLTGLPNRLLARQRLEQALRRVSAEHPLVGVLFIDLDRFKTINDSLGHPAGDALLCAVARRLQANVRHSDTVARLGGDEFIIILPGLEAAENVERICRKLIEAVCQPVELEGRQLTSSPSIGVSFFPNDGEYVDTLIKNADTAMYSAKSLGRRRFQFYAAHMNARALEELALENDLRQAIPNGELFLVYQPQVSLRTRQIIGAEALVRWQHPKRGLVPPALFIPVAEERGMIEEIGRWVLEQACRQNRAWQAQGLPPIPVAVNISAIQVASDDFDRKVQDALTESGLEPRYLELELTEGVLMKDIEAAVARMRALASIGVGLAIDDFGTGFSSLSYLRRLPLHKLKVDRSFVRDLPTSEDASAITESVIQLGHTLRLLVIAEGVETQEQLETLRRHGCDEVQGYFFSPPLPAEQLESLLRGDAISAVWKRLPMGATRQDAAPGEEHIAPPVDRHAARPEGGHGAAPGLTAPGTAAPSRSDPEDATRSASL